MCTEFPIEKQYISKSPLFSALFNVFVYYQCMIQYVVTTGNAEHIELIIYK